MDKESIDLLIEQKPLLKSKRDKLEAMEPGAYCMHRSWGFGQIKSYNASDNKLIIDFEDDKEGHPMDPAFCIDKLDILQPNNIIVRKRTEPDVVEEMLKKRPGDLIVEILNQCAEQSATPTEMEGILSRLIGPTKYKKWWTATKKVLVKDPRVATPTRKTDPYFLRDEPLKPEQEILEEFYIMKQPKKKILLAEKLYQISDNVKEIESDLPNVFEALTTAIQGAKVLNQAERLHGVWVRNDLARHLEEDPELIEPTSKSLILEATDINDLAANIPNGYHKRFLALLERVYPDEWKTVLLDILRSSSGKMTSETINFFNEHEATDLVAESLQKWLDEQNIKGPVLLWIIKNRNSKKYSKLIEGLISTRLLNAVLYAIDHEALLATGNRRIQLADVLSDDAELISDMLEDANDEIARDLAQSLLLNQGFEDLTKKSLLARFIRHFPNIQSLISGDSQVETEELIVSQKSLDIRKEEYDILLNKKIPENKEAIATAREHGDLKENSEYKMARQDQETLMARKALLEAEFNRARVSDFTEATDDKVCVGTIVEIQSAHSKKSQKYAILGAWDSNPDRDILSYKTPLGQALLGKTVNEEAHTEIDNNTEQWIIKGISRWVDSGSTL